MIPEKLKHIFDNYISEKEQFSLDPSRPRSKFDYGTAISIERIIPQFINEQINQNEYLAVGSVGKGGVNADVPWICVFDQGITTTAREGYYIVYLFDSKMQSVYLSLNQGWTQYEDRYPLNEARETISQNAKKGQRILRSTQGFSFDPIELNATQTLGKGYELGNILSKYYPIAQPPSDSAFMNDLHYMIGIYRELKGVVGDNILEIENVTTSTPPIEVATKTTATDVKDESPQETHERRHAAITGAEAEYIFEENAKDNYGWEVINRSDIQNIGYDFECNNPELFIEVKGCRDDLNAIRLTKREWEVAEKKGDKYILAIVSNVGEEHDTASIDIIKNPYKLLNDKIQEQVVKLTTLHIKKRDLLNVIN
jgi:hypothetical protein